MPPSAETRAQTRKNKLLYAWSVNGQGQGMMQKFAGAARYQKLTIQSYMVFRARPVIFFKRIKLIIINSMKRRLKAPIG